MSEIWGCANLPTKTSQNTNFPLTCISGYTRHGFQLNHNNHNVRFVFMSMLRTLACSQSNQDLLSRFYMY